MTFGSVFGRTFSPTFQPSSQAAAVVGGGWWDLDGTITSCIAAYQPKGAANEPASRIDLATGNYNATLVGTAGWDSNGWIPLGSNYYKTGIIPTANMSFILLTSTWLNHNVCGKSTGVTDGTEYFGVSSLTNYIRFQYGTNLQDPSINQYIFTGTYAIAGTKAYINGSDAGVTLDNSWNGTTYDFWILRSNDNGTASGKLYTSSCRIKAFAFYSEVLTGTQISNLHTAMAAL